MSDLLYPANGILATVLLFYTAWKIRPVSPGFAMAWFFLAMGCLVEVLGDIIWAMLEVFLRIQPYISLSDIFYIIFYPLVIVGVMLLPHRQTSRRERLTNGLDLSIVFLAAGLLYWNFLIGPLAVTKSIDWLSLLISVAYPILDLVLFAALMLMIYRKQNMLSVPAQALLIASISIKIVLDTFFCSQLVSGTYVSGTILDLSAQIAFITFGLAGLIQLQSSAKAASKNNIRGESAARSRMDSWLAFLPYAWLAATYGFLIYAQNNRLPMSPEKIEVVIGMMLALILTRQVISIMERAQMTEQLRKELAERLQAQGLLNRYNNELEERVHQRTLDLTETNQMLTREVEERWRAENLLESSLQEKNLLLKEIHHRVKNNLQVISSMLMLQASQVNDLAVMDALTDSQNRVQSMALIHEKLYQSANLANVDFAGYIESLVSFLNRSYISAQKQINLCVQAEPISLNIDLAIPCGLIVNELVSNSLKHAFPNGNGGEVVVQLQAKQDGPVELVVSDNGVGIPEGVDIRNSPSLGLQLVNALVGQMDGDMQFDSSQGTRFSITFLNSQPG
jgi:two-component sensor histidine kinase